MHAPSTLLKTDEMLTISHSMRFLAFSLGFLLSSANGFALQKRTDPTFSITPIINKLKVFMTYRNSFDTTLNSISGIYLTVNTVAAKKTQMSPQLTWLRTNETAMNARIQSVVTTIGAVLPTTTITSIRELFAASRPNVPSYSSYLVGTSFTNATANLTRAFRILDAMDAEYAVKCTARTDVQTFYNTFTEVTVPASTTSSLQASMAASATLVGALSLYDYNCLAVTIDLAILDGALSLPKL